MNISKIASLLTPLTLLALVGVFIVGNGIIKMGQENNALNFIFGIPLVFGAIGIHYLIRQVLNRNALYIWLFEFGLVAVFWYCFYYVW